MEWEWVLTESHVKHPVCFIKHKIGDPLQVSSFDFDQVYQSSRGGYQNLTAFLHSFALLPLAPSTIDTRHCKVVGLGKLSTFMVDLSVTEERGREREKEREREREMLQQSLAHYPDIYMYVKMSDV